MLALTAAAGCDRLPESRSPGARPEIVESLREDLTAPRHESDGGGRAWLESGPGVDLPPVAAGEAGEWSLVFESGPLGVAEGGWIFLQAPPFWGWSTPQGEDPLAPGYTTVATEATGVTLDPATVDQQLLAIRVGGRALAAGERVRVVYGAGAAGAFADRYAEREARFWVAVDGDGDGVRAPVAGRLVVPVVAGEPALLVLTLPSTARRGDAVRLCVAVLDRRGNAGVEVSGSLRLTASAGLEGPPELLLSPGDGGVGEVELRVGAEGILRVQAEGLGLAAESNPLLVGDDGPPILWADLHGHSGLSDGTGTPAEYLRYARDVAGLDVAALTDHDHWGMEPLALHPELWEEIRRETELFHRPGRFVTLLGYEWTNWTQGHRHVLYFDGRGEVLSAVETAYDTPDELWAALRGRPALTFAHHSAGGPVATNWDYPPDPELEPVTEIVSVHGSSEALDSPGAIYAPVPGNFVRDALDRGYRLGFVGSGDSHDGHPGLAHLAAASGGLAALLAADRTREGVLEALRARRAYATNGPRIVLRTALAGRHMGSTLAVAELPEPAELAALAVAPGELERLEVVRSGVPLEPIDCAGLRVCRAELLLPGLGPGEYVYVRAVQRDGGAAWSSPFFVE